MTQETSDETQAPVVEPVPGPALQGGGETAPGTKSGAKSAVKGKAGAAAEPPAGSEPEARDEPVASSPEELREQVAQTREELGDTVAQLAAKADVKQQARTKLAQAKAQTQQTYAKVADMAKEHTPQPVQDAAAQAVHATEGKRTRLAAISVGIAAVLTALRLRKRHN